MAAILQVRPAPPTAQVHATPRRRDVGTGRSGDDDDRRPPGRDPAGAGPIGGHRLAAVPARVPRRSPVVRSRMEDGPNVATLATSEVAA